VVSFESCPKLPACGLNGPFSDNYKEMRVSNNSLKRNTVCTWLVELEEGTIDKPISSLSLSLKNFYPENYTKYVNFYLYHCYLTSGIRSCKFDPLTLLPEITTYTLRSSEFKIYLVARDDIPTNATHMSITYNKIGLDYYYIALFIIAWVMTLIVVCVGIYTSVMMCKRCFFLFVFGDSD